MLHRIHCPGREHMWDRIRAVWRRFLPASRPTEPAGAFVNEEERREPVAPSLDEMRGLLRAGMTRDEFFTVLDDLVIARGLRMSLPTADDRLVGLPVAEGGELLCFLPTGVLNYVEYKGGIFLDATDGE